MLRYDHYPPDTADDISFTPGFLRHIRDIADGGDPDLDPRNLFDIAQALGRAAGGQIHDAFSRGGDRIDMFFVSQVADRLVDQLPESIQAGFESGVKDGSAYEEDAMKLERQLS